MAGKALTFRLDKQPPLIQLIASILIIFTVGTIFLYFFVFAGSLIFRTEFDKMFIIPSLGASPKENMIIRYMQFFQQVSLFMLPSFIIIFLIRKENENYLGMNKSPGLISVFLVILLALFIIPVTSFTGELNAKMNFPGWLSGVEEWMKTKEEDASNITDLLMFSSGFTSLAFNLIILAVVPAFSEELLFRGILQQLFSRLLKSGHIGVWVTSIIFSTMHFQFFGFLPRLLLGLSFGYLFFWSRNLWIPVIAHFVNNAIPVMLSYFVDWKVLKEKTLLFNDNGVTLLLIQIILCGLIFLYFWSKWKRSQIYSVK
jgi:membrane protease YdiL (CAAX protease family)